MVFAEKEPANLPWGVHDIDVVIESTGFFVDPALARAHIEGGGAKKVKISAPAKGEGAQTIVLGVNDEDIKAVGDVYSNASCIKLTVLLRSWQYLNLTLVLKKP